MSQDLLAWVPSMEGTLALAKLLIRPQTRTSNLPGPQLEAEPNPRPPTYTPAHNSTLTLSQDSAPHNDVGPGLRLHPSLSPLTKV